GPRGNERVQVRRGDNHVEVLAPAKVNLFFEVLSRRGDGFHEIETLMAPVSLYDTLMLADEPSGEVSISCRRATGLNAEPGKTESNSEPIPEGDANIAV